MFLNWGRTAHRPATPDDRNAIVALTRHERRVHTHLDWRPVEDWLGDQPFLVAERGQKLMGALACPPGPPDTAWLRLFALTENADAGAIWKLLWPPALAQLRALKASVAAALSMDDWIEPLLQQSHFERTHSVVVLTRPGDLPVEMPRRTAPASADFSIRCAQASDHPAIIAADMAAFASPWQLSAEMLEIAMAQSDYLTVAEAGGRVIGYQLTTANQSGAHLGRLAVLPEWQGRGLGALLTADMLTYYHQRGARQISVNTQDTNTASLNVYRRLGFQLNGERFPVYQLEV